MAILALIELPDFRFDLEWIGERLNIHPETAAIAITRMIALRIIHRDQDQLQIDGSSMQTFKINHGIQNERQNYENA